MIPLGQNLSKQGTLQINVQNILIVGKNTMRQNCCQIHTPLAYFIFSFLKTLAMKISLSSTAYSP